MLDKIRSGTNDSVTRTFDTNVRFPEINGDPDDKVHLKPRESASSTGTTSSPSNSTATTPASAPSISNPSPNEPVIYLAGDSTVVDQYFEPWAAWGQMLPRFFLPGIVIANHAESGETTKSFIAEQRLFKIMTTIKPGDFLFIQFAHNDMKPGAVPLDDYKKLAIVLHRPDPRQRRNTGPRHPDEPPHLRRRRQGHQLLRRLS